MTKAELTPKADQTPADAKVAKELSGKLWVSRFPGSKETDSLEPDFKICVDLFQAAIEAAGGEAKINSAFRPLERAYLMHWAYKIYFEGVDPDKIPAKDGVPIEWEHPTLEQSQLAAGEMAEGFALLHLGTAPSLESLHTVRQAVDMQIAWKGDLLVAAKDGTIVTIDTEPRTGMNKQLKEVGKSYGVIKFVGGAKDKPHWSTTGH